jgi:hypothetical protein
MRLENVQRVLEIVNAVYNRNTLADEKARASSRPASRTSTPRPTSFKPNAALKHDHAWLGIQDGALVLDLPMTSTNAARCVACARGRGAKPSEGEAAGQTSRAGLRLEIAGRARAPAASAGRARP